MNHERLQIKHIKNRLEWWFNDGPAIKKRVDGILTIIDQSFDQEVFLADYSRQTDVEKKQDLLIGFLYHGTRKKFRSEGRGYKPEKEKAQVKAVLNLLKGNHVHLTTGFGKSTMILPITTIVHALTRDENAILATTEDKLVSDLDDSLQTHIATLPEKLRPTIELVQKKEEEEEYGSFGAKFWHGVLSSPSSGLSFKKKTDKHTIFLTDDRSLVFESISDPACWGDLPWVYFDEAHTPFDRGSPYLTTGESKLNDESKENFRNQWLFSRIISQTLIDDDFTKIGQTFVLKDEAVDKIYQFVEGRLDDRPELTAAITLLSQLAEVPSQQISTEFNHWYKEYGPEDRQQLAYSLAHDFAKLKSYRLGSDYVYDNQGQLIVRDQYLGSLLRNHHFDPFINLALQTQYGKFSYNSLEETAGSVMNFSSFISLVLQGRMSATSGTLLFPDLVTKKPKKSAFSQFLEDYTHGKVVMVDWSVKTPPAPEICEDDHSAVTALSERLKTLSSQPTLITCWNEEEGKMIEDILNSSGFRGQVKLISGETPSNEADNIYQQMENNAPEARIVISTGKAGLGIDIKHSSLRVMLYNMPLTRLQVWQALGRRRGEGEDFHWFVAEPSLQKFVDALDPDIPFLKRTLGRAKSFEEVKALIESSYPKERLVGVNYLFERYERLLRADADLTVAIDAFYHDHVRKMAEGILEDWLRKKIKQDLRFTLDENRKKILDSFIHPDKRHSLTSDDMAAKILLHNFVGIPETLYTDVMRELYHIYDAQGLADLVRNKLPAKVAGLLGDRLTMWGERRLTDESAADFFQIFDFAETRMAECGISRENVACFVLGLKTNIIETNGWGYDEFRGYCRSLSMIEGEHGFFQAFEKRDYRSNEIALGYVSDQQERRTVFINKGGKYFPLIDKNGHWVSVDKNELIKELSLFDNQEKTDLSLFVVTKDMAY